MTAIFGIVSLENEPVSPGLSSSMIDVLRHRGTAQLIFTEPGRNAMGCCSRDIPRGDASVLIPQSAMNHRFYAAIDARLDDRQGLEQKLGIERQLDHPLSDGVLILRAFEKWGVSCVEHLLGDYAFVIWNEAENEVFCARDHLGIRPFYYSELSGKFVFASTALAVARGRGGPVTIDKGRVADFLVEELEGINCEATFFEHVQRLPPAHTLTYSRGRLAIKRYWAPDPETRLQLGSDGEYVEAFDEALGRAVADRLFDPDSMAAMLSGGLDSSTVVGYASDMSDRMRGGPLKTYSGVSGEDADCRETRYIRRVIDHCDVSPRLLSPSDVPRFESQLRKVDDVLEDPFDDAWTLLKMIYLSSGGEGCSYVFDGIDGDGLASLTSAYPTFLLRRGKIATAVHELRGQHRHYYRTAKMPAFAYFRMARSAMTPSPLRAYRRKLLVGAKVSELESASLIAPGLVDEVSMADRVREYWSHTTVDTSTSLRRVHADRVAAPYLVAGIERYGRLGAYFGVKPSQPLLDKRLVEFCVALPWNQKCRDGWSKYAMRKLAERRLPASVAWRPGWEQISWKFSAERSRLNRDEEIDSALAAARDLEGVVSAKKVRNRVERIRRGEVEFDQQLVNFLSLARWMKRVVSPPNRAT